MSVFIMSRLIDFSLYIFYSVYLVARNKSNRVKNKRIQKTKNKKDEEATRQQTEEEERESNDGRNSTGINIVTGISGSISISISTSGYRMGGYTGNDSN